MYRPRLDKVPNFGLSAPTADDKLTIFRHPEQPGHAEPDATDDRESAVNAEYVLRQSHAAGDADDAAKSRTVDPGLFARFFRAYNFLWLISDDGCEPDVCW